MKLGNKQAITAGADEDISVPSDVSKSTSGADPGSRGAEDSYSPVKRAVPGRKGIIARHGKPRKEGF